jgi:F-type H+-transporting ATPase subunit gamma
MPSLKSIRKRILSTKSTQKITRAMKMVAAARLRRAQQRITELRLFAVKTGEVLRNVALHTGGGADLHPLLARRKEEQILIVVLSSDRGLAGAFNSNVNRASERLWREETANGKRVAFVTIGRKARDYFRRRGAEIIKEIPAVTEKIQLGDVDVIAAEIIDLFTGSETAKSTIELAEREEHVEARTGLVATGEGTQFDSVYVVFNEFKSAMTQRVIVQRLLPIEPPIDDDDSTDPRASHMPSGAVGLDFVYEPSQKALLDRLLPLYVQISLFRATLESVASEHGARMTAMDAATGNAKDLIASLTLQYNRARQAAITKELMEIIGGAEALK